MSVIPMPLDTPKWMFTYGLSSFIVIRVLFYVVIIYVYGIPVFAALDNAFIKFGALVI